VIGFDLGKGRLVVEIEGRQVGLKPSNCAQKAIAEDGEEYWADEPPKEVSWSPGTVVCVDGLVSKPEMNGTRGTLRTFDVASGRFDVELTASEVLRLKPANILI
jgi:hypothetical protein